MFTLVCFTPLWYLICLLMCVCVCVCVCVCARACALEWFWVSLTVNFLLSVYMSVCLVDFLCAGQCGFKYTDSSFPFSCICIHMSMYVYVCGGVFSAWCFRLRTCVAQGLVNGYSMRFWFTRVCSLNGF